MRKSVLFITLLFAISMAANAQKFALIDTEYIMKNIPAAQSANEQMQEATKKYQAEVEVLAKEAQKMFQDYQAKKEDEIVAKEKAAAELKRTYFGPEGELAKMRNKLITPIQDEIYEAVKAVSQQHGYDMVVDRASAAGIIFANPRIDISDEILRRLGYSN